jgi:hypothetical protein
VDKIIDVGKEYHHRLADRDIRTSGNPYNAKDFREKYLSELDNSNAWENGYEIILDFRNVKKIGPGFANEAFGYFSIYTSDPKKILEHIIIINTSEIKMNMIREELCDACKNN